MSSIDPAVDKDVNVRNPALDMFSAANGFDAAARRAPLFGGLRQAFYAAQGKRNNEVLAHALERLQRRRAGQGPVCQRRAAGGAGPGRGRQRRAAVPDGSGLRRPHQGAAPAAEGRRNPRRTDHPVGPLAGVAGGQASCAPWASPARRARCAPTWPTRPSAPRRITPSPPTTSPAWTGVGLRLRARQRLRHRRADAGAGHGLPLPDGPRRDSSTTGWPRRTRPTPRSRGRPTASRPASRNTVTR